MIDMKMTADQGGSYMVPQLAENTGPKYPYGTKICLDAQTLRKLAIGEGTIPQVGEKMMLNAQVEVVEVSKSEDQIEAGYSIELQITGMEFVTEDDGMNEQQKSYQKISRMYGNSDG
jgi:hypothetical protein